MKRSRKKQIALNKDKVKKYLHEYTTNGFNKTKAMNKVCPDNKYTSNNSNVIRFHKSAIVYDSIMNDFSLEKITVELIIKELTSMYVDPDTRASDKIKIGELLGKWKAIWTDKTEITGTIKHTQDQETELSSLRDRITTQNPN